jgi:hypothetical protein
VTEKNVRFVHSGRAGCYGGSCLCGWWSIPPYRSGSAGAIEEAIRAGVAALPADSFVVVTRLPSGRLTVFINTSEEPELLTRLETALSQLR